LKGGVIMARKRSSISQLRSFLYSFAKFLGDIQAVRKGPKSVAKRIVRRSSGKATGRMLRKLFK